jgi:hypothetical protein
MPTLQVVQFQVFHQPIALTDGGTGTTTSTGSGSVVLSASPTLTGIPLHQLPLTIQMILQ